MNTGLEFEWDDQKAAANAAKHGVTFEYAAAVFLDPCLVDFDASNPQDQEVRRKAVGVIGEKVYVVVYTDRPGVRRLISARRANKKEIEAYG
jgi:uncharacterized DUF497 family protein